MERLRAALELAAARPAAGRAQRGGGVGGGAARRAGARTARRSSSTRSSCSTCPRTNARPSRRVVVEAGSRAGEDAPLAWLRMEPDGERAAMRLATWPGGEDRLLARAGYHGTPVELS